MEFEHYRYLAFFLTTLLVFHDACSRYIAPLAMIGGMVKKNCSDPLDKGELCWSDSHQANFLGAFYYGYALQMIPTFFAARIGFTSSLRMSTLVSGVIQLVSPMTMRHSGEIAVVLQAVKGFVAGLFIAGNFDCAHRWSIGEEGKSVISLSGIMLFTGSGVGPFMVGMFTKHINWAFPFYLSGAVFLLLFLLQCVLVPEDPARARLMSNKERLQFELKQKNELVSVPDKKSSFLSSIASILSRPYLYFLCIYSIVHLTVYYPEFLAIPFFFNEFQGLDTEFLAYLQLSMSLINALSVICWRNILTVLDKRFSWLSCRMSLMMIPLALRSINIAVLPFSKNIAVAILLLVINNLLSGSAFSGGIVTVTYELDPSKSAVVFAILNGVGEASGFLVPLLRAWITTVDDQGGPDYWEEYEKRWSWFFLICGGLGFIGIISLVVGLLGWKDQWKKHPSLENTDQEHRSKKEEGKEYKVLDQKDKAMMA